MTETTDADAGSSRRCRREGATAQDSLSHVEGCRARTTLPCALAHPPGRQLACIVRLAGLTWVTSARLSLAPPQAALDPSTYFRPTPYPCPLPSPLLPSLTCGRMLKPTSSRVPNSPTVATPLSSLSARLSAGVGDGAEIRSCNNSSCLCHLVRLGKHPTGPQRD